MTEYVKFISETQIKYAPKNLGSICNYNLNKNLLFEHGYKPLIKQEKPNKPFRITYKETKENIEEVVTLLEEPVIDPQEQYKELAQQALEVVQNNYQAKLQETFDFTYNETLYKLKPMFMDKYSMAYSMGLSDVEAGEENSQVNLSVYNEQMQLINMTISFNDFKQFFNAVKDKVRPIEQDYQSLIAEISQLPTVERLQEIINGEVAQDDSEKA